MFNSLKSKLKSWLGKTQEPEESKEEVSSPQRDVRSEKKHGEESHSKSETDSNKKTKEKPQKKEIKSKEKTSSKKSEKKSSDKKQKLPTEEELKAQADKIKDEIPHKPITYLEPSQPDLEKISELTGEPKVKEPLLDKTEEEPKEDESPKEKRSFFSKLFGKKPQTSEIEKLTESVIDIPTKEDIEEIKQVIEEKPLSPDLEIPIEAKEQPQEKSFLSKFISKIKTTTLTKEHVDEIFDGLEIILLENNVALEVVDKIKENLHKDLVGIEVKKQELENTIINTLKDSIKEVLIEPPNLIEVIKKYQGKPYVIIFFGINGSGKTTSIAKLAHKLKSSGISVALAAADTFRAAAIQQLETHAQRLGLPIIKHDYGSDPTAVAFDAKKYAEQHKIDCLLIDTAGRMYTKENLIKQMEKMIRVIRPNLKIFVGESITGNDGTQQAKTFQDAVGIDGIILSKADVDEKGGTILSISYVTNSPIYYLGTGQSYDDLEEFNPKTVLKKIGME